MTMDEIEARLEALEAERRDLLEQRAALIRQELVALRGRVGQLQAKLKPALGDGYNSGELRASVLAAVTGEVRLSEIAAAVGRRTNQIGSVLARLEREGSIVRVRPGLYAPARRAFGKLAREV